MRTKIIAGFPGIGKSACAKLLGDKAPDSDSSYFSWVGAGADKKRNPDFPANYIAHIKENVGKYRFIFVSTHAEVRKALVDNCIFFYLVYPPFNAKDVYLERYRERGSDDRFVQLLSDNWTSWIYELASTGPGCQQVPMTTGFLADMPLIQEMGEE